MQQHTLTDNPTVALPDIRIKSGAKNGIDNELELADLLAAADTRSREIQELIEKCGRSSRKQEALTAACFAAGPLLVALSTYLQLNGGGSSVLPPAGLLFWMLYVERQQMKAGCHADAADFAAYGVEAIGDLVRALRSENRRVERVVAIVLAQLLPTLTRSQFEDLSIVTKTILYTWLRDGSKATVESRRTILAGIAPLADLSLLHYLEGIVKRPVMVPAHRAFRNAAKNAISQILTRTEAEAEGRTLSSDVTIDFEERAGVSEHTLEVISQLKKKTAVHNNPAMRRGYLIANWTLITPYFLYKCVESISEHNPAAISAIWAAATIGSTVLYKLALMPEQARLARELAASADLNAIGQLAEAIDWPDYETQAAARSALIQLLPKLKLSDTALLNSKQRRILNNRLDLALTKSYLDTELQIKILQAWQQIGDLSSLQAVKNLVAAKPLTPNAVKVQRAAQHCLPVLMEVAQQNESSQMLLRASAIPTSPEDATTLVRPSITTETPAEQLVRPADHSK